MPKDKRSGRPTKCTTKAIMDAERVQSLGATDLITAEYIGIKSSTFYEWMRKGELYPDSIYGQFAESIKRGRSQAAVVGLQAVQKAATEGQWTAAAWMLERRYGYKNVVETEQRNQPDSIDLETEEGRQQAVDMLNQLPISILKNIDHRRLYAALDAGEE